MIIPNLFGYQHHLVSGVCRLVSDLFGNSDEILASPIINFRDIFLDLRLSSVNVVKIDLITFSGDKCIQRKVKFILI